MTARAIRNRVLGDRAVRDRAVRDRAPELPDAPRLSPADVAALGLVGLRARPLRGVLSTLGIAIGTATLVLIVGISGSSNAGLNARLNALGANLLLAQAQAQGNVPTRFDADAEAMTLRIGPVTAAGELGAINGVVRRNGRIPRYDVAGLNAFAATPSLLSVLHGHVQAGSFLTDQTAAMRTVVLGHAAATNLGIDAEILPGHPQIRVGELAFTVVGILDALPVTSNLDYGVFVGWNVARSILHFDGRATAVYLRADQDSLAQVSAVLGPTLLPQAAGLVNVSQPSNALAAKEAVDSSASTLVLGLVLISLIVGGIGIANTMYLAVIERRREIGLRRALGATRGQIRLQFVAEAAVLAVAGSLTGALLGAAGVAGYALYDGLPVVISAASVAGAIAGGLLVGVIAGLYPALRAAQLTPTESLAST
jgi:putative ABC transport system permease protein